MLKNIHLLKASSSELLTLSKEYARYLINSGNAKAAVVLLEEIRSTLSDNPKILAQLITAYTHFDQEKVKEYVVFCLKILYNN